MIPRSMGLMWLSPDCKHFSKAKGGKPVSPRVRGLAWVALRWMAATNVRVVILENVEEFQTWCLLDDDHQPVKSAAGATFDVFIASLSSGIGSVKDSLIQRYGYRAFWNAVLEARAAVPEVSGRQLWNGLGYDVDWRELRGCDYGAPTIRKRFYLIARRDGGRIAWPEATHGPLGAPYRTAGECIDWSIPCPSIFTRNKRLADKTLRRIARGLVRYVIETDKPYIVKDSAYYFVPRYGEREGQSSRCSPANQPMPTIVPSGNGASLVSAFIAKHYTERANQVQASSLFNPLSTITAQDHNSLVSASLGSRPDRSDEVRSFLVEYYGTDGNPSLWDPMHTVTTRDRFAVVTASGVPINDIGMRMLTPRELYGAQGFPETYKIEIDYNGKTLTKTAQVRMVGNSVVPQVAAALVSSNYSPLENELVVDAFAGGGGASTGIEIALGYSPHIAINHDPEALALHEANHPHTKHLPQDIWEADPRNLLAA